MWNVLGRRGGVLGAARELVVLMVLGLDVVKEQTDWTVIGVSTERPAYLEAALACNGVSGD